MPWRLAWLQIVQDRRLIWDRGAAERCEDMLRHVSLGPAESSDERYVFPF